ncbi:MAG TPA: lipocalin-like domain-containing protein [Candidatus Solibacter sp.]|nr:lipocalin-like domain-containing protein [Candidatus Solibacter sp.]
MASFSFLLLGFVLCAASVFAPGESEIRDQLVGTWKLVSAEETLKDGTTRPYPFLGPRGKGVLMYQRNGYMCANLVNPDRPKWVDTEHPTNEEKLAAAGGAFAYCGRYEIDVKQRQIIHIPEVASDPGFVGSRQVRPYSFEGARLVFSDVQHGGSSVARWKIVWEKVE